MKKNIELLEPDRIYHIYNRGINGENIFQEERNYRYFLEKYAKYIEPIADTFAYCLLKNHFHIAIRTKSEAEIVDFYVERKTKIITNNAGWVQNPSSVEQATVSQTEIKLLSAPLIISKQFSDFFNSYA